MKEYTFKAKCQCGGEMYSDYGVTVYGQELKNEKGHGIIGTFKGNTHPLKCEDCGKRETIFIGVKNDNE